MRDHDLASYLTQMIQEIIRLGALSAKTRGSEDSLNQSHFFDVGRGIARGTYRYVKRDHRVYEFPTVVVERKVHKMASRRRCINLRVR